MNDNNSIGFHSKFFFNVFELYTGFALLLLLCIFGIYFRTISINQYSEQSFRAISRFSDTFSSDISYQKKLFDYVIRYQLFDKAEILELVDDFVICNHNGTVARIIKQPPVSIYFRGYEIDQEEIELFDRIESTNVSTIFGPYYSSLSGKNTISFVYKTVDSFYIANLDTRQLFKKVFDFSFLFSDILIFSSSDGIVVYRSNPNYQSSTIDPNDSTIVIDGTTYYHYSIYNKDLRHIIHLLRPASNAMFFANAFIAVSLIIIFLWLFGYFARRRLRDKFIWDPVYELTKSLNTHNPNEIKKEPDVSTEETMMVRNGINRILDYYLVINADNVKQKQFLNDILDSSPNMVIATDFKNQIIYGNKRSRSFFSDLSDASLSIFKVLQLDKNEIEAINGWKRTREELYQIHEKRFVSDTGESYLNISIDRMMLESEESGFTYVIIDITSRKMISDNQWQIRKMETLSTLAGGFAHDFNNLMTIILGNLDVYHYVQSDEKRQDIIVSMKEAAVKASELVKQVLMFSKQDKMTIQPIVIEEHIERILKLSMKSLPSNIQLIDALGTESTVVLADINQFIQVVLNLIFNARDAILRKKNAQKNKEKYIGRIEISLEIVYIDRLLAEQLTVIEGKYVRLGISDDGVGIPPDIKPLVFDPFFTTKARGTEKGVGLGLSVAYSIIKNFNGGIDIQSLPDIGTDIYIYLPMPNEEMENKTTVYTDMSKKSHRILLIDDDEDILDLGEQFLLLSGYEVDKAGNGKKGIEALKAGEFSLAIIDMLMPEYDGWYFLDYLQKRNIKLPVIVTTGFFESIDPDKLKEYGFIRGFLDKPFTLDKLIHEIGKALSEEDNGGKE